MKAISKILLTGATGQQGYAVARVLLQNSFSVYAMARDLRKDKALDLKSRGAELVQADFDDPQSLEKALEGMEGVFAVQDSFAAGTEREIEQACRLADMALAKKVSYFVYSSIAGADKQKSSPHFEAKRKVEKHIEQIDLPYTIFRPVFFYYNYLQNNIIEMLRGGSLKTPLAPNKKLQHLSEHDYALIVSMAFSSYPELIGKTIEVASTELSGREIADVFAKVLNRPIHYEQISFDEFEKLAGHEMRLIYEWFDKHDESADFAFMRRQLGDLQSLEGYFMSNRLHI